MMFGGLVVTAAASVSFIIPLPIEWLIVLRLVQGLGFAAVIPAQLAAVADVVPRAKLGRAYGWGAGAQQAGYIGGGSPRRGCLGGGGVCAPSARPRPPPR